MKLSQGQLQNFFKQLGEMLNNGVALVPALDVLGREENGEFSPLARFLANKVQRGSTLSKALADSDVKAPNTLIVLLRIGEKTGRLPESMLRATSWLRQDWEVVQRLKSSLTYPLFVVGVAGVLTLVLFTTVVPTLLEVVQNLGGELPLPTRIVAAICWALSEPMVWLLVAAGGCFAAASLSVPAVRLRFQKQTARLALELPLIGPTLGNYYFVRFCSGFSILIEGGVNVLEAVSLAQKLSGHPGLLDDEKPFRERVQSGTSLAGAMKDRDDLYPSLVIGFAQLGEESAKLSDSLERAALFFDMTLQERLHTFRQALEPILTVGVGALVSLVLLATLLPLYSVVANIGS